MQFHKAARVAPATVTAVSRGQHANKRIWKPQQKVIMDRHIKVDPRVWQKAKELSQGDPKRLVVESPTSVLVLNPRKHK